MTTPVVTFQTNPVTAPQIVPENLNVSVQGQVLSGRSDPVASQGNNGDLYINVLSFQIFFKNEGSWNRAISSVSANLSRTVEVLYEDQNILSGGNHFRLVQLSRQPARNAELEIMLIVNDSVRIIMDHLETNDWLDSDEQAGAITANTFAIKAHRLTNENNLNQTGHTTFFVGRRGETGLVIGSGQFTSFSSYRLLVRELAVSSVGGIAETPIDPSTPTPTPTPTPTTKKYYYGFMQGEVSQTLDVTTLTEVDLDVSGEDTFDVDLTTPGSGNDNYFVVLYPTANPINQINILGVNGINLFDERVDARNLNSESYSSRRRGPLSHGVTLNYMIHIG